MKRSGKASCGKMMPKLCLKEERDSEKDVNGELIPRKGERGTLRRK